MKKIRRIKEFALYKYCLERREAELRELIHADWIEIKDAARLRNVLKNHFRLKKERKSEQKASWIERLTGRVSSFVGKIAAQAENKIESCISRKLNAVLNNVFARRTDGR
jgi:hypothetical protein